MAYTPLPNPWKNVPYVGAVIDALQSWAAALVTNITVKKAGTDVGSEPAINFIDGDNILVTATDDPGNKVDVQIAVAPPDVQFSSLILYDLLANRPVASIAGRLFYATDTDLIYRDNGTTWDTLTIADDDSGLQPLDSDLTAIAALTPSDDDIIQRKAGAWVARTVAQYSTDLVASGLPATLVGYGAVGSRPAASEAGLLYFATDEGVLYRDNGASWDPTVSDQIALIVALGD